MLNIKPNVQVRFVFLSLSCSHNQHFHRFHLVYCHPVSSNGHVYLLWPTFVLFSFCTWVRLILYVFFPHLSARLSCALVVRFAQKFKLTRLPSIHSSWSKVAHNWREFGCEPIEINIVEGKLKGRDTKHNKRPPQTYPHPKILSVKKPQNKLEK